MLCITVLQMWMFAMMAACVAVGMVEARAEQKCDARLTS